MLQMRPNCESCDTDLGHDSENAFICSFECTFCRHCAEAKFDCVCPNCGGRLVARPARSDELAARYPASTERVRKDHGNWSA